MAQTCTDRLRLAMFAAALAAAAPVLGLGTPRVFAQPAENWSEKLSGTWCDAEEGCTHWWTIYYIDVGRDDSVAMYYVDRGRFQIFNGTIKQAHGKWRITVPGAKPDENVEITVLSIGATKEVVKGKMKLNVKGKVEGVESVIPLEITDATIEGKTKLKAKDDGPGHVDEDEEEDAKGRTPFEGQIKGKIHGATSQGNLKGSFTGTFKGQTEATLEGTYLVPPAECSEAGRAFSKQEAKDFARLRELEANKKNRVYETVPGRPRLPEETSEQMRRGMQPAEQPTEQLGHLIALAKKTNVVRPAERHTSGKFMRRVKGTLNGIEPYTITLELPTLPILDRRCSVIGEIPKRTLKLVKQHYSADKQRAD